MPSDYVLGYSGKNEQSRRQRHDPATTTSAAIVLEHGLHAPRHFLQVSQSVNETYAAPVPLVVVDRRVVAE